MQLAAHEAQDLHELTLSCVNSVTTMAFFLNQVKNPELKAILQQHFDYHVKDYNIKVEYLSKPDGPTSTLQVPPLNNTLPEYTQSQAEEQPVTPRTQLNSLNDREIATSYMLTLKRAGREYAWAAMEASNPGLRSFLEDAFKMSSHHAFDVWQWMVKQGYYPLKAADPVITQTLGQMYDLVQGPSSVLQ
ncbi:spore coat protein [Desulfosporosinus sp.]|uniref:spore coat protein n=1 Tax=Desulfosporosinus sp. TaxID=157907 RepID=UPI000E8934BC|nr:spore coat protein [Desulfosporosinus sp.]MBC2722778.1 spore coat protein [Desulfosporosinus sp.]MBC2725676.1 spore coat protein [Desulfosporosinus sp.]HBV88521.1 spore coat protein [Desulfosporosinus sp.]